MDEDSQPSLVSIQRWRDSQGASSSQVLTGDESVSKRDSSHRSEARTVGQMDLSSRLGFFMAWEGDNYVLVKYFKWLHFVSHPS